MLPAPSTMMVSYCEPKKKLDVSCGTLMDCSCVTNALPFLVSVGYVVGPAMSFRSNSARRVSSGNCVFSVVLLSMSSKYLIALLSYSLYMLMKDLSAICISSDIHCTALMCINQLQYCKSVNLVCIIADREKSTAILQVGTAGRH